MLGKVGKLASFAVPNPARTEAKGGGLSGVGAPSNPDLFTSSMASLFHFPNTIGAATKLRVLDLDASVEKDRRHTSPSTCWQLPVPRCEDGDLGARGGVLSLSQEVDIEERGLEEPGVLPA